MIEQPDRCRWNLDCDQTFSFQVPAQGDALHLSFIPKQIEHDIFRQSTCHDAEHSYRLNDANHLLEPAQGILQRFTFLQSNFCQADHPPNES